MKAVIPGLLRLTRPANLPTAAADILAGIAISGSFMVSGPQAGTQAVPVFVASCLLLSSVFLYAGGVVLNDVFDLPTDRLERPERPIPSGRVPRKLAGAFGAFLLGGGAAIAFMAGLISGILALFLLAAILLYNGISKRHDFAGPLNMGVCRGLNLLLGMSAGLAFVHWYCALVPLIYIFAITLISRGEVRAQNRRHIFLAGVLYALVLFTVLYIVYTQATNPLHSLPFLALFSFLVFRPLSKAYRENTADNIRGAVVAGVLSLIVLDASWAAAFSGWGLGLALLMLLPFSLLLSKIFAVT